MGIDVARSLEIDAEEGKLWTDIPSSLTSIIAILGFSAWPCSSKISRNAGADMRGSVAIVVILASTAVMLTLGEGVGSYGIVNCEISFTLETQ